MGYLGHSFTQIADSASRTFSALADDGFKAAAKEVKQTMTGRVSSASINSLVKRNYMSKGMGKQLKKAGYGYLNSRNVGEALGDVGMKGMNRLSQVDKISKGLVKPTMLTKGLTLYSGASLARRAAGPGNLTRDNKGRFDIAGIPFV
ncbi:MAG: hypothetical protein ACOCUT_02510 [bacterium]